MFVFYYLVIISFTYVFVYSEGEKTCDCTEIGVLKDLVQQVLFENRIMAAKLRRLEERQHTAAPNSKTTPVSNDRIELLEQKVEDIEGRLNSTFTTVTAKEKQEGLGRNIGTIMKKTLYSEKKERTKFASSLTDRFETFTVALNHTIDERFEYITAIQNEHSHDIKETFNIVRNNISAFQENTMDDVNRRLDRINLIENDLKTFQQNLSDSREMVEALEKLVDEEKEWLPWSKWGKCSASCNGGLRERYRKCSSKSGCLGNSKEFSICNTQNCIVRLVSGSNPYEGRLEVIHNGAWGTVCDDDFTDTSAAIVCKMLNFPSGAAKHFKSAHFGQGSLPILLDNVRCGGSESTLFNCQHLEWGTHNCDHTEDIGIACIPRLHIRLVEGSDLHRGRVEVSVDGTIWGTICDDSFDNNSAKTVCRMLGYPLSNARVDNSVSQGSGTIFLDDVSCVGTENSLIECIHSQWGKHDCDHTEDVGVICA